MNSYNPAVWPRPSSLCNLVLLPEPSFSKQHLAQVRRAWGFSGQNQLPLPQLLSLPVPSPLLSNLLVDGRAFVLACISCVCLGDKLPIYSRPASMYSQFYLLGGTSLCHASVESSALTDSLLAEEGPHGHVLAMAPALGRHQKCLAGKRAN